MRCPTCGYEFDTDRGLECPRCGDSFSCASLSCGECGACPSVLQGLKTAIASAKEATTEPTLSTGTEPNE